MDLNTMTFDCILCQRSFETQRDLNIHSKRSHQADIIQLQSSADIIDTCKSIHSTGSQTYRTIEIVLLWMNVVLC